MANDRTVAGRLRAVFETLGIDIPLALRGWDGSRSGPADAPALVLRHPRALRRLLWQPNQLGLGRAWVAGELSVEGDLYETLRRLERILTMPEGDAPKTTEALRGGILRDLLALGAIGPQPAPPPEEARLAGTRHSPRRDRRAISHHYDVGNDFYRIVLGETMVYSCAYWTSDAPTYGLDDAQRDKLALICRKLALEPGMRLLDVGCGWGSLAIHAAREHGVSVLGPDHLAGAGRPGAQAGRRGRAGRAGRGPAAGLPRGRRRAVRRDRQHRYGRARRRRRVFGVRVDPVRPAAPRRAPAQPPDRGAPDRSAGAAAVAIGVRAPAGAVVHRGLRLPRRGTGALGTTVNLLEGAGFEVRDVESLREHYARTLRAWVENLDANWSSAVRSTTPGRARVWRLYMAGSAVSFEAGRIGVNQVLAVKPHADGRSGLPPTRVWLA
jgi:cyclopropane-fatty-acyl-phospholipid synthase